MSPGPAQPPVHLEWLGEAACRVSVDADDPLDANLAVHAVAARLRASRQPGILDVVPGMVSLTVHLDLRRADLEALESLLTSAATGGGSMADDAPAPRTHVIPVRYGGDDGPDLDAVARVAGLAPAEVVARHRSLTYRVCFLGFLPGFAYLGLLPERLRVPRRPTPRVRVPAGSVAIADMFSGIYPVDSPGGWHVIGRTTLTPFDLQADEPSLFAPGDLVRFEAAR